MAQIRPPTPKQLITGFLAIAVVASSATFAFSWLVPEDENRPVADLLEQSGIPGIGKNAFVEQLSEEDLARYTAFNLTDTAAESLAKKLIEANPAGPLTQGGQLSAKAPDVEQVVAEYLAEDRVVGSILAETLPYNPEVTLAKTTSPEERGRYLEQVVKVMNERVQTETLVALPDTDPSLAALDAAEVALHDAIAELEKIEVPKDMKDLHVNLVRSLAYSKEILGLRGGSSDPLKEMVLLEDRSRKAAEATAAYEAEFAKLELTDKTSWTEDSADLSFFDRVLGVKEAKALPVFVPTSVVLETSPSAVGRTLSSNGSWVQKIIEWAKKLVTEIIKDQIVHKIIQQTIRWVQGGGTPQFVTNWKSLLRDSFSNAAGNLINEIYPKLCQGFGPLVKVALFPVQTAPDKPVTCTLDQVVANVENFYTDFTEGGWIAYGASLKPSNNIFGAIFEVSDLALREGAKAEEASKQEASGNGYQPTRRCVKPTSPRAACVKKCVDRYGRDDTSSAKISCIQGCQSLSPALTACEPGGYEVSTPGELVGNIIETSFAAPILRVVNAQDVIALVNAVANSIIKKLIDVGNRGLRGVTPNVPPLNGYGITNPCAKLPKTERKQCEKELCENLEPAEKAACEELVRNTPDEGCLVGEEALESGNASGADPSATEGWYCDSDAFTLEQPGIVRLYCIGGTGAAFITTTDENCNERPDLGTPGWTFDASGEPTGLDGNPPEFVERLNCPGGESLVSLPAGTYRAGGWTNDNPPSTGAMACLTGLGGATNSPGGNIPPTASASCGTRGNDIPNPPEVAPDLSNVSWLQDRGGNDISSYAQTANLSSVTFNGSGEVCLDYDKANEWPAAPDGQPFPDWSGVIGNPWIFVYRGGRWQATTFEWAGAGRDPLCKGAAGIGSGGLGGALILGDFTPIPGETYGFMVSTLGGRTNYSTDVKERSNVVMARWQGPFCTGR